MPNKIAIDQPIPNFSFNATSGLNATIRDYKGKCLVLYFYPKDNTPGCTSESKDFRDNYAKFKDAGCVIFGISRDSLKSHENFKQKLELPFELIADTDQTLCEWFNTINPKTLFGRKIFGITRSTFLIDQQGILRQEWRNVSVKGHAEQVYAAVLARVKSQPID